MSFSLHLANFSAEQADFGYSAAHETLLALHVFFDCKHHPLHVPWVIKARKKLSPGLKEEIDSLSFFYQRPIVTFWDLQEDSSIQSFENELNKVMNEPIQSYQDKVIGSILKTKMNTEQELNEFIHKRYPKSKDAINLLLQDPLKSREQFLNLMESFWDCCLKEEWPRIEELLLKDISYRGRILMNEGILPMLDSLSPEIVTDLNNFRAVIRRISKDELHFAENDRIFLAPSYFVWPHLFVKQVSPIGINYSVMENQYEAARSIPPENLLKFLRAMGDLTRLQIVKFLSQKPRSTRELAGLIGVTEGAVSKNLKQLLEAGIVESKRESYYVFYQLNEKSFSDIAQGLFQFIHE